MGAQPFYLCQQKIAADLTAHLVYTSAYICKKRRSCAHPHTHTECEISVESVPQLSQRNLKLWVRRTIITCAKYKFFFIVVMSSWYKTYCSPSKRRPGAWANQWGGLGSQPRPLYSCHPLVWLAPGQRIKRLLYEYRSTTDRPSLRYNLSWGALTFQCCCTKKLLSLKLACLTGQLIILV